MEGSLWVMQWRREDGQGRAVAWVVAHQTRKKTWGSWSGVGCGEQTVSGGKIGVGMMGLRPKFRGRDWAAWGRL